MKVKIKDHDLDLHYGNRLYIIYENLIRSFEETEEDDTVHSLDPNSITAQTSLVFAALQATLKYNKIDETLTFDDVNDIIDENGGRAFFVKFNQWFTEKVDAEAALIRQLTEEPKAKKTAKKK